MSNPLKVILNKFFPSGIQTQNNNIDTQTFDPNLTHNVSMISGFDGIHENLAVVDKNGNLHVNNIVGGYYHYYTMRMSTVQTYVNTVNLTFPATVSLINIIVETANGEIAFVDTTTGQLGMMFIIEPGTYSFNLITTGMALYAQSSTSSPTFVITAFY